MVLSFIGWILRKRANEGFGPAPLANRFRGIASIHIIPILCANGRAGAEAAMKTAIASADGRALTSRARPRSSSTPPSGTEVGETPCDVHARVLVHGVVFSSARAPGGRSSERSERLAAGEVSALVLAASVGP